MKKILFQAFSAFLAMLLLSTQVFASASTTVAEEDVNAVVNYEESDIYSAFDEISELVEVVATTEGITYADVEASNSELVENVSSEAAMALATQDGDEPPFISAFLWGCLFSWVGVVVVYVTTDGNSEFMKPAWRGCIVAAGCQVVAYIVYYVAIMGAYASYY